MGTLRIYGSAMCPAVFPSGLGLALALTRLDDLAYKGVVAQDLAQLLIAACQ